MKTSDRELAALFSQAELAQTFLVTHDARIRSSLQRQVESGKVVRPARGVYARASYWRAITPPQRMLHLMRSLQALHPDWTFCHESAAVAFGLSVPFERLGDVHVATSRANRTSSTGTIRWHVVERDEFVFRQGLRVTSLPRTTFDCMRTARFGHALAVADSALRLTGSRPGFLRLPVPPDQQRARRHAARHQDNVLRRRAKRKRRRVACPRRDDRAGFCAASAASGSAPAHGRRAIVPGRFPLDTPGRQPRHWRIRRHAEIRGRLAAQRTLAVARACRRAASGVASSRCTACPSRDSPTTTCFVLPCSQASSTGTAFPEATRSPEPSGASPARNPLPHYYSPWRISPTDLRQPRVPIASRPHLVAPKMRLDS